MGSDKEKDDAEPLLKFEVGRGWKKYIDKLSARNIAVIIIALGVVYLLVEFLRTSLSSSLKDNNNALVIVISVVLLAICFIVSNAIGSFSSKNTHSIEDISFYSPVHSMILQILAKVPPEQVKGLTLGMWANTSMFNIDYASVSHAFTNNISKGRFTDQDFLIWTEMLKEINTNGFWLNEARYKWFATLESRFSQ